MSRGGDGARQPDAHPGGEHPLGDMRRWDAIVIGAGPAGSVTAHGLATTGARVLLVDRQRFPRSKVCGSCLSAGALAALEQAGLRHVVTRTTAPTLERLRLVAGGRAASLPLRGGRALSRRALDAALVEEAAAAGATVRHGARATLGEIVGSCRRVRLTADGVTDAHEASVVIDASGLGCPARPRGDRPLARERVRPGSRIGVGALLRDDRYDLSTGELRMVVGRHGYVGLVRVEDGAIDVAACLDAELVAARGPEGAVQAILDEADVPAPGGSLEAAWRGTPALTRRSERVAAERLFRVGDATGYVEPFTGEGMCWAIDAAVAVRPLALRALESWSPGMARAWTRRTRRRLASAQRLCRVLARGLRRPRLVLGAVTVLGAVPGLASPFLRDASRRPSLHPLEVS